MEGGTGGGGGCAGKGGVGWAAGDVAHVREGGVQAHMRDHALGVHMPCLYALAHRAHQPAPVGSLPLKSVLSWSRAHAPVLFPPAAGAPLAMYSICQCNTFACGEKHGLLLALLRVATQGETLQLGQCTQEGRKGASQASYLF